MDLAEWTYEDSQIAIEQGWEIFSTDRGDEEIILIDGEPYGLRSFELQQVDERNKFTNDAQAWEFVWNKAYTDSNPTALKALNFLRQHSVFEFNAIEKFNLNLK